MAPVLPSGALEKKEETKQNNPASSSTRQPFRFSKIVSTFPPSFPASRIEIGEALFKSGGSVRSDLDSSSLEALCVHVTVRAPHSSRLLRSITRSSLARSPPSHLFPPVPWVQVRVHPTQDAVFGSSGKRLPILIQLLPDPRAGLVLCLAVPLR